MEEFIIYSGASVCLLNPRVYGNIPEEKTPVLQGTVGRLIAANGENIPSTGKAVFQLGFKDI
jgi:hypothetical protein